MSSDVHARITAATTLGARHARRGAACQDAHLVRRGAGGAVALALADGHGSARHGEVGARLAVEVAAHCLLEAAPELATTRHLATIGARIVRRWQAAVRALAGCDDASSSLLPYGSTLLALLATPEVLATLQIGDGNLALIGPDGGVTPLVADDADSFADATASLCLDDAAASVRVALRPRPRGPALLVAATDGFANSYASQDAFEQALRGYWATVFEHGLERVAEHLPRWLGRVTNEGAGDDVTVALAWWDGQGELQ